MHILLTVGSDNTYTFNETPWQQVVFASGPMRAIVADQMVLGQEVL